MERQCHAIEAHIVGKGVVLLHLLERCVNSAVVVVSEEGWFPIHLIRASSKVIEELIECR
jgi:hypothetical protein